MFLKLNHKNLDAYKASRVLMKECYRISLLLPQDEKFNMVSQIRRAALSVKLNLAEGSSRKSSIERKRYYEISRGSIVELDAAFEAAVDLNYLNEEQVTDLAAPINNSFALITNLINAK